MPDREPHSPADGDPSPQGSNGADGVTRTSPLGRLSADGRSILFTDARTANTFSDTPVSNDELTEIWELAKWAPTSANAQPMRVLFVRTAEGRERLLPHMLDKNRAKTANAPAVAILAMDLEFHEHLPRLVPFRPEIKNVFAAEDVRHESARFNTVLQAGYFILAIRAAGLAAGPMIGFDNAGVDAEFFAGTTFRSVLVVNIGHPGENAWFDRLPRLDNEEVISWA
jgi:3-hydroxypropanoate dehydrogenase